MIEPAILAIGLQAEVARYVERQLWGYTYTFLVATNVSKHLTLNSV